MARVGLFLIYGSICELFAAKQIASLLVIQYLVYSWQMFVLTAFLSGTATNCSKMEHFIITSLDKKRTETEVFARMKE